MTLIEEGVFWAEVFWGFSWPIALTVALGLSPIIIFALIIYRIIRGQNGESDINIPQGDNHKNGGR